MNTVSNKIDSSGRALRRWTVVTAAVLGVATVLLARLGNPPNMGICSACFIRDTAGGLGLFSGPPGLQYLRPEIPGFLLGSFIAAAIFRELTSRGGSAPVLRFLIGAVVMLGALVFLGCPIRLMERLGSGDVVTAGVGLLGLIAGTAVGSFCISRGFSLGPSPTPTQKPLNALAFPLSAVALAAIVVVLALDPGSDTKGILKTIWQAPVFIALGIGVVLGFLAQRSRFCTAGGFRDALLWRDFRLLKGYLIFVVIIVAGNLVVDLACPASRLFFDVGAAPLAHAEHLWNFLGLLLVGFGAVLLGGCPFRQLIAAGQGHADAAVALLGLLAGAALCHNFDLAAKPATAETAGGPSPAGMVAVLVGLVLLTVIGLISSDRTKRSIAMQRES